MRGNSPRNPKWKLVFEGKWQHQQVESDRDLRLKEKRYREKLPRKKRRKLRRELIYSSEVESEQRADL